jgi:endogenous inhibitor of DNA gyrase (YacG/DUF329 family)
MGCFMPMCRKCSKPFPNSVLINGRRRNLQNRQYCLICSPYGLHNTKVIHRHLKKRLCLFCHVQLTKRHQRKFCSNKCQGRYRWENTKQSISDGRYKSTWSGDRLLRRYLAQTRGKKCEQCNLNKWNGQEIPLTVHHKDGDAGNNLPSNLNLLCWNCHGLTINFGRRNKNSTRYYRYN